MSALSAMKAQSKAKDAEEARSQERRRNLLVLVLRHLVDQGYLDSAARLETEAGQSLSKLDAADNVDLLTVLQEYEEYFEFKFGRKAKLVRKLADGEDAPRLWGNGGVKRPGATSAGASAATARAQQTAAARSIAGAGAGSARDLGAAGLTAGGAHAGEESNKGGGAAGAPTEELGVNGVGMTRARAVGGGRAGAAKVDDGVTDPTDFFERRLMKPLPDMGSSELRELAAAISRDIYLESPDVRWGAIAGLDAAKRLLQEAVVMPVRHPHLFQGILAPWKGILLYGPPGTGKTMLAKAVATECRTTFFNISASSIISKWRGESEKLVRVLFELARYHAPSTIFLDEVDALMGQRGGGGGDGGGEHEASRRMKTELLIQMDGLAKTPELVFLLAATNLPWELDTALLRRLEKRILVPLPSPEARARMLSALLPAERTAVHGVQGISGPRCAPGVRLDPLAAQLDGYSGSDVFLLAKEAAMRPLRRTMARLDLAEGKVVSGAAVGEESAVLGPVTEDDLAAALASSRPTAHLYAEKYAKFEREYGQVGGL